MVTQKPNTQSNKALNILKVIGCVVVILTTILETTGLLSTSRQD